MLSITENYIYDYFNVVFMLSTHSSIMDILLRCIKKKREKRIITIIS